ncbi:MAG: pyridoxal-dependent decarboxylase [Woeseiaceae bacterium]|nr:pyridoxal-dependent decarboxylase [Woeseiaceae bacterium]
MSELKTLLAYAAERGMFYREAIDERAIAPTKAALAAIEGFVEELPDAGLDDAEVLAKLDKIGAPASVGMTNPRYFGFVIGGSLPVTVATNWLTTAWDQNVGMHEITPAASTIERVAGDWLVDLLGLPEGTAPAFVTGATVANFSALAAARNRVYGDIGWDVEADGLFGAPPVNVIISAEAHPTLTKSLGMLGFGRERLTRVAVDGQGRMMASELPPVEGPTIVCAQAGNINTGSFDPIGEICDIVRPQGAWVHVDGAFGLWAAVSAKRQPHIDGFEKADSWATDGHKWLNVPYDSGLAFVRDPQSLRAAMSIKAEYLVTETEHRNPSDYTPELSRRARGIDVWAALSSLGRNGVEEMIDRCCDNAMRFADGLRKAGYEILNDVVLNQVLVSFGPPDKTLKVIEGIQRDGTCWCGSTVWQRRTAMRISVCNWATTAEDVDRSLEVMTRIARGVV